MVDYFIDSKAMFSAYAKKWGDDYLEKEFHGAQFIWDKEKAKHFASIDIETLLFDKYFLNAKSWMYPGIIDTILEIYEERKKRDVNIVCVLGGFGCLPAYAPIKTNDGYTTIGDVSVGDKILGVKGNTTEECNVIRKINSGKKEVFRIYTKDGSHVDATKEHIFPINEGISNLGALTVEKSVKEIMEHIDSMDKDCWFEFRKLFNFETQPSIDSNNEIIRYESLGFMETYDITIDNESHCFLSYDDFVTNNSGKTAGVGASLTWLNWFEFTCKFLESSDVACPQEYYSLKPTSKIAFIALSKTVQKSIMITFSEMKPPFMSGFNNDYFPFNPRIKSRLDIPGNDTMVFPNTATEAAMAGYSVFSYVMDEISFLEIVDSSSRARGVGKEVYDQAESAFMSAEGRRWSRFKKDGMGILISSVNYDEDFLVTKMRKAYNHIDADNVFIKVLLPWEVNPEKFGSGEEYFYFDTSKFEIIIDEKEIMALDEFYVNIPIEDIIFGNADNDPNDKLLADMRSGRERK